MTDQRKPKRPGLVRVSDAGDLNVRWMRANAGSIGCTQSTFAGAIGVSVKTLRYWEQRRRRPTGPARILLAMIGRDPWLVFDVFNNQHRTPLS
jgi:putative transcriptional regulator